MRLTIIVALACGLCLGSLSIAGCHPTTTAPTRSPTAAPVEPSPSSVAADDTLRHRVRVFAGTDEIELEPMLDRLAKHDAVFVGETHLDDTTHEVELRIFAGLAERKPARVVLSLEMFERDVQPVLDAYLRGEIAEPELLAQSRPWGNYAADYRPLVEAARRMELPVVAANFPRPLLREVGDAEAFAKARREHPDWVPREIRPASPEYWARVQRTLRGHGPAPGSAAGAVDPTYTAQNLWDNAMGEAVADALKTHPKSTVVHVAGGFHIEHGQGTVAQLRARNDGARVATVSIVPVSDLSEVDAARGGADYVVFALARVQSVSGGRGEVTVAGELHWSLVRPDVAPGTTLPTLIWLPDNGERAQDVRTWLTLVLGDRAQAIVVEPPGRSAAPDGRMAADWLLGVDGDAAARQTGPGLARLVDYAQRRLSAGSIVIAGRGAGGTAALWAALDDDVSMPVVAFAPVASAALQRAGIPDDVPSTPSITVVDAALDRAALAGVLQGFAGAGRAITEVPVEDLAPALPDRIAAALGVVAARPAATEAARTLALPVDSPLARRWAESFALVLATQGIASTIAIGRRGDEVLDAGFVLEAMAQADGPSPPVAFGGTTVLVLGRELDAKSRQAWRAWAEAAATRRGAFRRLEVHDASGRIALRTKVAELFAAGRSDILVVPAAFALSEAQTRALLESAGVAPEGGCVHVLPGLGGDAVAARAKALGQKP